MSEFSKESAFKDTYNVANTPPSVDLAQAIEKASADLRPPAVKKQITEDQIAQIRHILDDLEISLENHADEGTIFSLCDDVRDILDKL